MDKLSKFLNLLYSDSITDKMLKFYDNYCDTLYDEWRCDKKFVTYLKAFYILVFLDASDKMKDKLISNFENNDLSDIAHSAIDRLNAMYANTGEFMTGFDRDIEKIAKYQSDELYSRLDEEYGSSIAELFMDCAGIITIDAVKSGDKTATYGYKFTKDEIKTLEDSLFLKFYNDALHTAYDYKESNYKLKCNYDAIENEVLKKMAFHTDKDNPEFKIVFPNGQVMNYYEGDIRFYDLDFVQMVNLVKTYFINFYYNGEDDDSFKFWLEVGDINEDDAFKPYDEMDDDLKEKLLNIACQMVWEDMTSMLKKFSTPMVEEAQKEKEILDGFVYTYHLAPSKE